ncbi:hypothetical protein C8Q78DRAFT_1082977 [Trametes maxima]|nr:hypothetical protein C8Q78DRAFT_1082977 [Trametes maxima]
MAPITYHENLQIALHHLVEENKTRVTFQELVDRVVQLKGVAREPIAPDHHSLLWTALISEVKGERVGVRGDGLRAVITVTASGLTHYKHLALRAAGSDADSVPTLFQTKDEARAEYIRLANVVEQVVEALKGHEPESLLLDSRNIPSLVHDNMESINFMQEQNQEIIDRIDMTADHIDYLLSPP